jgi:hypothetical protein
MKVAADMGKHDCTTIIGWDFGKEVKLKADDVVVFCAINVPSTQFGCGHYPLSFPRDEAGDSGLMVVGLCGPCWEKLEFGARVIWQQRKGGPAHELIMQDQDKVREALAAPAQKGKGR